LRNHDSRCRSDRARRNGRRGRKETDRSWGQGADLARGPERGDKSPRESRGHGGGERRGDRRADFILSILPPGDALSFAQRFVPALTASNAKPVYVECNAINPVTVEQVAKVIAPTGCPFVDAGIIGQPPKPGGRRTTLLCFRRRGAALRHAARLRPRRARARTAR
jgi:hypothetical protein